MKYATTCWDAFACRRKMLSCYWVAFCLHFSLAKSWLCDVFSYPMLPCRYCCLMCVQVPSLRGLVCDHVSQKLSVYSVFAAVSNYVISSFWRDWARKKLSERVQKHTLVYRLCVWWHALKYWLRRSSLRKEACVIFPTVHSVRIATSNTSNLLWLIQGEDTTPLLPTTT